MQPHRDRLPVEADFCDPSSENLDERHAVKMFLGKTTEEAEAMFRRNFLCYQEDLTYMRAPAFRFYVLPAINYLLSDDATGDSDAASSFCRVLESRLEYDPDALAAIRTVVQYAIKKILANFDRFDCSRKFYGDVPGRYRVLSARLSS